MSQVGMKFIADGTHAKALRRFEAEVCCVIDLISMELAVEMYASFEGLREAGTHAQRTSAAGYLPGADRLAINNAIFNQLSEDMKIAVLGHEVGHAIRHRKGLSVWGGEDCYEADVLAIDWGVGNALIDERTRHYGQRYGEILRGVKNGIPRADLLSAYRQWQTRRNAGIE